MSAIWGCVDAFTNVMEQLAFNEILYKAINNMWMYAFSAQAAKDGCRIMLNGQVGNNTFSWGDHMVAAVTYFKAGKLFQSLRTLSDYGRWSETSRKRLVKTFLNELSKPDQGSTTEDYPMNDTFVNRDLSNRYKSAERIVRCPLFTEFQKTRTFRDTQPWEFHRMLLSLAGEGETKIGLAYGLAVRDVARDIRIYDFCKSAPLECFVKDGRTRRMVRDYLSDLLPNEIMGGNPATLHCSGYGLLLENFGVKVKKPVP